MPRPAPISERFWSKTERRSADECWPWLGYRNEKGYGRIAIGGGCGRHRPAQQIAWELEHGRPFPSGMFACHSCDNPSCVNPAHIWPGTVGDNTRDMAVKRRHGQQRKTHCPQGHEYTAENTIVNSRGHRSCRACRPVVCRRHKAKRRVA